MVTSLRQPQPRPGQRARQQPRPAWHRDALTGVLVGVLGAAIFGVYWWSSKPAPAPVAAQESIQPAPLAVEVAPPPTPVATETPVPAAPIQHGTPPMVEEQSGHVKRVFLPLEAEIVDCRAEKAPAWCGKVRYATSGERMGTVVAILRPPVPGNVYLCMGGRHVDTAADSRVPMSVQKKLQAWSVTLEPREKTTRYEYYVIPEGSGLTEPAWMATCPVGRGPDPA